jgi:glycosyltransferase involved in cell wall biosynthesis
VAAPVTALGNHQGLAPYRAVTEADVAKARAALGLGPDDLAIGYVGGFSQNRALLPFVEAAALVPDVQFHLWGDGSQREPLERAVREHPNAHYHGWLHAGDLPVAFKAMDIIYYCLRGNFEGAVYNAPNTLSQAMAAGRPIVATDVGDLGRIVRAEGCGQLVEMPTAQAIAGSIAELRNADVRRRLGANGLRAAEERYNLGAVAQELASLYAGL